ncbi:MAG: hypothetical protein ACPG4T_10840, partial [Nannocystaceae bacterium]
MTLERPYRLLQNFHPTARVALGAKEDVYASDLLRDIQQLAAHLPHGVDSGCEIVVVCRDRYLFAVAVLATWAVGLQVALPPNLQPELLQSFSARPGVVTMLHDGVAGVDAGTDVRRLV